MLLLLLSFVVVAISIVGWEDGVVEKLREIEGLKEKRRELYVREVEERSRDVGRICGLGVKSVIRFERIR